MDRAKARWGASIALLVLAKLNLGAVKSVPGRLVLSSYESFRATGTSVSCLSPWGDSSVMILPCIRMRDVAVHVLVVSTGGTAAVATPLLHLAGDAIIQTGVDSIAVEVATVATYDLGAQGVNTMIIDKIANRIPKIEARLRTTAVKNLLITLKFTHTMDDAALGFYRSSVHSDTTLFSSVADYVSIQKGWFSPYLFASSRRPIIPRAMRPDIVFCHGPFLFGDYRVAETLLSNSASVLDLVQSPTSTTETLDVPSSVQSTPTPSRSPSPAEGTSSTPSTLRRLLVCLVGIKPHRGLWATSARPGESIFHYFLFNGCPCILLPAFPGCPLLAWDTLTLADMSKKVSTGVEPAKWRTIVKILFEYVSLCVDWDRIQVPGEAHAEVDEVKKQNTVYETVELLVEGAVRTSEYKDGKKFVDLDRAGIVMFRMP